MAENKETAEQCRRRFSSVVSAELVSKFEKAYAAANSDTDTAAATFEAKCFVTCLERLACEWPEQEAAKRRRERMEAFANALDAVVDVALKMDDPALGYALHSGLSEMVKHKDYSDEDRQDVAHLAGYESIFMAYRLQHEMSADIKAFCYGVRTAISSLPALDKRYSTEFQAAKLIEDFLGRRGIKVSTTDTGLAGSAFLETMKLSGRETVRAGYWIKLAIDDEGSWAKFTQVISARTHGDLCKN